MGSAHQQLYRSTSCGHIAQLCDLKTRRFCSAVCTPWRHFTRASRTETSGLGDRGASEHDIFVFCVFKRPKRAQQRIPNFGTVQCVGSAEREPAVPGRAGKEGTRMHILFSVHRRSAVACKISRALCRAAAHAPWNQSSGAARLYTPCEAIQVNAAVLLNAARDGTELCSSAAAVCCAPGPGPGCTMPCTPQPIRTCRMRASPLKW